MVFTLEVAISTMPKNVEQFVLLFDASKFIVRRKVQIIVIILLSPHSSKINKNYRLVLKKKVSLVNQSRVFFFCTLPKRTNTHALLGGSVVNETKHATLPEIRQL